MASNTNQFESNKRLRNKSITGAQKAGVRLRKQRFAVIIGVFFAASIIPTIQILHTNIQLRGIQKQEVVQKRNLAKVKADNSALNTKVKQLNDSSYLQKLVRDKYLYSKSGETVYNLPEN